jgi:imidazolonepropionase-like amidohydrolase
MTIVIRGARLIDGSGREPLKQAVVVVKGDRIQAVGPEGKVPTPRDAVTLLDVEGRTILPALTDTHANMVSVTHEEDAYGYTPRNIAASILRGVANGRRCLDVGITTVRVDTSGHHGIFALKEAFASGMVDGPRLLAPGRAICMTGGHGWNYGNHEADGADEVRKAAREELKAGADWVKLMATGGAGSPTEGIEDNQMTLEELTAGVEEAHKKGRFAFAHVSCAEGARNCIAAGIDSIEHGLFLEEDIVKAMQERGIFLVPTLIAYRTLVERGKKGLVPDYMYQRALKAVERHVQSFRMALKAGVKIAAGTDSGQYWNPMGHTLLTEMEYMNQEGMASMDVLISATSRAAELLHLSGDLGTIEVDKLADLLILEGDPLANIGDLRKTWMVFKEGREVFRTAGAPRVPETLRA